MAKQAEISNLKIRRVIFHILLGLVIILLAVYNLQFTRRLLLVLVILGIVLSIISIKVRIPGIFFMIKRFETPRYMRKFPGKSILFFVAGCLLVLKIFETNIALASIAILTFGDPFSYIFSHLHTKRYSRPKNIFKNVYGTIAGIIIGFFAASLFVDWVYALIASVLVMIAESFIISFGGDTLDDNFYVPLGAATIIYLLVRINFLGRLSALFA